MHRNLWKIDIKNTNLQKLHFHQKIGNQLKRTWHHIKAETLKKPCVKFEEGRLNTLRENQICKKVNQNVIQERVARRQPGQSYFINRIFSSKKKQLIKAISMYMP